MTWMRVRAEAARSRDFPNGSSRHRYEFVLPLDEESGRFDRALYERAPELCTVHRFWEGQGDAIGEILHAGRDHWVFSYDPGKRDDEPIRHFADQVFREGEYLNVSEPNGTAHAFRIVRIEPAWGTAFARPR